MATISDRKDRGYPFQRTLFENPNVLYHGTWSSYASKIEERGFLNAELPFNLDAIKTIMNAGELIGIGSYATSMVVARRQKSNENYLSMTPNFWYARAYATDGGGETVRMMVEEARDFEDVCARDERRLAIKARWEPGLKESPTHALTLRAVELLSDKRALHTLGENVRIARELLESVTKEGFPTIYAVEVEPEWFLKDDWDDTGTIWKKVAAPSNFAVLVTVFLLTESSPRPCTPTEPIRRSPPIGLIHGKMLRRYPQRKRTKNRSSVGVDNGKSSERRPSLLPRFEMAA